MSTFNSPPENQWQNPIQSDAAGLVDNAKRDLSSVGDEVKQQVGTLKEEASAQLDQVAEKAKSLAGEQKDLLAKQVTGIVAAIGKVADELESNNDTSSGYVRAVADGAKKLSSTIEENDVNGIIGMAQDFGRRQPVAFMGAAALLGFAASRFVLASAHRKDEGKPGLGEAASSDLGVTTYGGGNV